MVSICALFKWQLWAELVSSLVISYLGGGKRLRKGIRVEYDIESGEPHRSPTFNFMPALISRNWAGSIYSPLSNIDREQQDLGGIHDARLPGSGDQPSQNIRSASSSSPNYPTARWHTLQRSPFRLLTNIKNIFERLCRPAPGVGKQRVEWLCVYYSHPTSFIVQLLICFSGMWS
jgi:hypothetical protein